MDACCLDADIQRPEEGDVHYTSLLSSPPPALFHSSIDQLGRAGILTTESEEPRVWIARTLADKAYAPFTRWYLLIALH
jgi:hypothetical protein